MLRFAVAALLSAILSGCFASDRPLFAPESGVRALGDGGKYATFEQADGKDQPSDPIVVRPRGSNGYDFINEKGAVTPATFHPLPGGEHVAQLTLEGDQGYGYVLFHISGKEALVVPAECSKQNAAKMASLGVVQRNQFECRIDKVADPVAFFTGLKRSEPVARMVRE